MKLFVASPIIITFFLDTVYSFTFRDIRYVANGTSTRNPRRLPSTPQQQIVFEPETERTTRRATTLPPTSFTTASIVTRTTTLSPKGFNLTLQNTSAAAISDYFPSNKTEAGVDNNDTVIINGTTREADVVVLCQPPSSPSNYLSDEYIKSKLCSNINGTGNYRFDLEEKVCSEIGKRSHCGKNMIFYSYARSSLFGHCDCDYSGDIPLIYHPQTKRCYYMYQQGFCRIEEWVERQKGKNGTLICTKNTCYNVGRSSKFGSPPLASRDMAPEYVPLRGNGPCVRLSQPSQFCAAKQHIVAFRWPNEFYPNCGPSSPATTTTTLSPVSTRFLGEVATPECKPGSLLNVVGTCEPEWEFD